MMPMSTLPIDWQAPIVGPVSAARLSTLAPGTTAEVLEVQEPGAIGERLLEMGLTPGTSICVVRRGLFGDPMVVQVRGYLLSLRNKQAQQINVMPQS